MTLKEKIALCSGKDNWHTKTFKKEGIASIMFSDGPHGLRKQPEKADMLGINKSVPATCFPTAAASACSWDKNLLADEGRAIAQEAAANGVQVILGPGANIKRNPLCGRNFEYFSEDPLLSGELAAAYIQGAQSTGVGTSLKHFACNNQEYFRMASDSIIDERTLREIYLRPFEIAVKKSQPLTVMCSYNKINGVYASENKKLLTDILRTEWGFKGAVITDWGAIGERHKSFEAGCDLAMPGGSAYGEKKVYKKIKRGDFDAKYVEQSAKRVLDLIKKVGGVPPSLRPPSAFSATPSAGAAPTTPPALYNQAEHHALAKKIAVQSAVLLQNNDNLLPILFDSAEENSLCFIGDFAQNPRYQGYGSSYINPTELHTIRELMPQVPFAQGYDKNGNTTPELLDEALALAAKCKTAIIFAGLPPTYESESFDRDNMKMPSGQSELIEKICQVNKNVAVVLYTGSALECPWADKVKAVLLMGLPGQAGAEATLDLIFGAENPSGHLAESWPQKYEDCVCSSYYSHGNRNAEYREGIFCGYRYYDTAGITPRYAFGHGLSYTQFALSDLAINSDELFLRVKNSGKKNGACVIQIYIEKINSNIARAKKELKAFEKVFLTAGEEKTLSIKLTEEMFTAWHNGSCQTEGGEYRIHAGTNSVSPELSATILRQGVQFKSNNKNLWYANLKDIPDRANLEALLASDGDSAQPQASTISEPPYSLTSTFIDAKNGSAIMRFVFWLVDKILAMQNPRDSVEYKMIMTTISQVTLRSMQTAGGIRLNISEMFMHFANKNFLRGIIALFK